MPTARRSTACSTEAAVILAKRLFSPRAMYRSNIEPLPRRLNEMLYRLFACERRLLRFNAAKQVCRRVRHPLLSFFEVLSRG